MSKTAYRQKLSFIIKTMLGLLILCFAYILFAGLGSQQKENTQFDIAPGLTEIRRHHGERVWVSHLSKQQHLELNTLNSWLLNPESGCKANSEWCLIQTKTEKQGIEIRFSAPRPPQLNKDMPWFGGYINPISGAMYDLLGRAYKGNPANTPLSIEVKQQ